MAWSGKEHEHEPQEVDTAPPARPDEPQIEDMSAVSPEDARVAELLADEQYDPIELADAIEQQEAADAADSLEDLGDHEAAGVLGAMDDQAAADALAEMEQALVEGVIEDLIAEDKSAYAARLIGLMAPDDAADVLGVLDPIEREDLLARLPTGKSLALRQLLRYPAESAGGLMTTDIVKLREKMSVAEAIREIRDHPPREGIHDLLVTDAGGRLVGIVSMRDLLVSRPRRRITSIMSHEVKTVHPTADREEVANEFARYDYAMMPVVDDRNRLLGVITFDDVIDIIRSENTEDVQMTVGAGRGEAVYSSLFDKFRGRFPWLVVSTLIMTPAAIVVLSFEELIGELAILAVLMPVIAALAGNAGHQALAVTIRGLVLDEVRGERTLRLIRRELLLGLLTGTALGILVGLAVTAIAFFVPEASWQLGVVVAVAMIIAIGIGTLSGAGIPLIMHAVGVDPAAASAIFLIMITDSISFAALLGLASLTMQWLVV